MSSNDIETLTCTVRAEVLDWFEKFIKETCGPEVIIQCIPNGGHFNTHTSVEISGSTNQIIKAENCITSVREVQHFKMTWFQGAYYTVFVKEKERVIEELNKLMVTDNNIEDFCTKYTMLGFLCRLFHFESDMDRAEMLKIEEIFISAAEGYQRPIFISYPKSSVSQNHSSAVSTTVLTALSGKFMSHLFLEDVLSLEIANGGPDPSLCFDRNLNHDIQKYLKENYSVFYTEQRRAVSFENFKHSEVLRYAIQKYHNIWNHIYIPNILPVTEIQSLSRSYNIKLNYKNITHIDFKTNGSLETINFCAIYHFDATREILFNYDSNQASENYSIIFNEDDDSLDDLDCRKEFATFAIKCQSICSPKKTNAILKWMVKHFKVRKVPWLILQEFDLNQVPNNILQSLISMTCQGYIEFNNMCFTIETFLAILKHSNRNFLLFTKCHIASDHVGKMLNNSKLQWLSFHNMDLEINIICMLKNAMIVDIFNCHILSTSFNKLPINSTNIRQFHFTLTSFSITTLVKIIYGLRCVQLIKFESCSLTPCVQVDTVVNPVIVTSKVMFRNINFKFKEIFEIFKIFQFEELYIDTCKFSLDDFVASNKFKLKPVKVEFKNITLNFEELLTILDNLNNESKITLAGSFILPTAAIANISTKRIQMELVVFCDCRLELQTLLNILSIMSTNTDVVITRCHLLDSSVVLPNSLIELSKLYFTEMNLSINHLFGILGILKENSRLVLKKCEIDSTLAVYPIKKLLSNISIEFQNMTIEDQFMRLLIQSDLVIGFNGCHFEEVNILEIPLNSHLIFREEIFDLSKHLRMLGNATPTSTIAFVRCYLFTTTNEIPNIVLVPNQIQFSETKFGLDVLVTIMERLSDHTPVFLHECFIKPRKVSSKLPIKIPEICFTKMTLEITTLLDLLKNCIDLSELIFDECEIVGSNSKDKIILPVSNELLANVTMNNISVQLKNVPYSSGLVQLCQQLTGNFIIEYYGKLSSQAIIELYIKTPVYGSRLKLMDDACTKLFYFELFAEYFHYLGYHKLEPKTDMVYDAPTFIIPFVPSLSLSLAILNNLEDLKIKLVTIYDGTTKLEFLRDGKPIDLFYELNDLPDDSEECTVDYY